jgi:hypothetical protein
LARMKGVVTNIHIVSEADPHVIAGTPVTSDRLFDGLRQLVESLNSPESAFRASFSAGPNARHDVRVGIGVVPGSADVVVACDEWRVLMGSFTSEAKWEVANPIGPALAAAFTGAEVFKRIVRLNDGDSEVKLIADDFRVL